MAIKNLVFSGGHFKGISYTVGSFKGIGRIKYKKKT